MANIKNNSAARETQRKLLEAAGEVFAEHGFHSATIKEITERAGASIAAVNYHFSDKSELYAAVIRRIGDQALRIIPPEPDKEDSPETQFLKCVEHIVIAMLGRPHVGWESILMAREFAQPSPAIESMFKNVCQPVNQRLSMIISEITGRNPDEQSIGLSASSILGQCVYFLQHQAHIDQLHDQLSAQISHEQYAKHIAQFSLAGLGVLNQNDSDDTI
ncbi:hypothetical protein COB72_00225 [bacterium]|nr:MAG: hypothetical protein COB72_00225 [bacterium]